MVGDEDSLSVDRVSYIPIASKLSPSPWLPAALFCWLCVVHHMSAYLVGPGLATYHGAVPLPVLATLGPSRIRVARGILGCIVSSGPPLIVYPGIYHALLQLFTTVLLDAVGCTPVGGVCSDLEVS